MTLTIELEPEELQVLAARFHQALIRCKIGAFGNNEAANRRGKYLRTGLPLTSVNK